MINLLIATVKIIVTLMLGIVVIIGAFFIGVAILLILISALSNFVAWVLDKIN